MQEEWTPMILMDQFYVYVPGIAEIIHFCCLWMSTWHRGMHYLLCTYTMYIVTALYFFYTSHLYYNVRLLGNLRYVG